MLASRGETGEPCGVPAPTSETTPPSNTPARSQLRSSFNICRSTTRRSTWAMSASWSMFVEARLDVGVEHPHPTLVGRLTDGFEGLWAERFGRNPKLTGRKVGLEDRLEDDLRCRHDHPVGDSGNAERPGLARLCPALGCSPAAAASADTSRPEALRRVRRGRLAPTRLPRPRCRRWSRRRRRGRLGWWPRRPTPCHITSLRASLSKRA